MRIEILECAGRLGGSVGSVMAQVTISRSVGSSHASGSALTARSLEPASASASPPLSAPPQLALCLSLKNKIQKNFLKRKKEILECADTGVGMNKEVRSGIDSDRI